MAYTKEKTVLFSSPSLAIFLLVYVDKGFQMMPAAMIRDLVDHYCELLVKDLGMQVKPIKFETIASGAYATECSTHITFNLEKVARDMGRAWSDTAVAKKIFSLLMHEVMGHKGKPFEPAAKLVVKELNRLESLRLITKDERDEENYPLHFQCAIFGYGEAIEILRANGFGDLLTKLKKIQMMGMYHIRLKWCFKRDPDSYND
jgi:hypothetical protein